MPQVRCHYERTVGACEPATYRVHDSRGCVDVCFMHATWRQTTSQALGHSAACPEKNKPWVQVTLLPFVR